MTNEEAAILLKQTQITLARGTGKMLLAEALRLAISALEERKKGKWIFEEYPDGYYNSYCSNCGFQATEEAYLQRWRFCPNCGADMRTKEMDCDYERAVEQLEHDILYEPTYNPYDGSM